MSGLPQHDPTLMALLGVHGAPFVDYAGVKAIDNLHEAYGYCEHVSNLFPTWHRPYLALYEVSVDTS